MSLFRMSTDSLPASEAIRKFDGTIKPGQMSVNHLNMVT